MLKMITKFKIYEAINVGNLEIGDYVICREKLYNNDVIIQNFINNNIGKFVKKGFFSQALGREQSEHTLADNCYGIEYDNVPEDLLDNFDLGWRENPRKPIRWMKRKEIKKWSKNKEDLEHLVTANKYNL